MMGEQADQQIQDALDSLAQGYEEEDEDDEYPEPNNWQGLMAHD